MTLDEIVKKARIENFIAVDHLVAVLANTEYEDSFLEYLLKKYECTTQRMPGKNHKQKIWTVILNRWTTGGFDAVSKAGGIISNNSGQITPKEAEERTNRAKLDRIPLLRRYQYNYGKMGFELSPWNESYINSDVACISLPELKYYFETEVARVIGVAIPLPAVLFENKSAPFFEDTKPDYEDICKKIADGLWAKFPKMRKCCILEHPKIREIRELYPGKNTVPGWIGRPPESVPVGRISLEEKENLTKMCRQAGFGWPTRTP